MKPNLAEEWLNIQFIAKRSEAVGSFLVGPFIVILLMILSRISLFDKWDWPIALIIVLSIHSLGAISCALILNASARNARRISLERLTRKRLQDPRNDWEDHQFSLVIEDIKNIKQGAFAPLTQQPYLHAFIMPFGGIGTAALIELLMTHFA